MHTKPSILKNPFLKLAYKRGLLLSGLGKEENHLLSFRALAIIVERLHMSLLSCMLEDSLPDFSLSGAESKRIRMIRRSSDLNINVNLRKQCF